MGMLERNIEINKKEFLKIKVEKGFGYFEFFSVFWQNLIKVHMPFQNVQSSSSPQSKAVSMRAPLNIILKGA